MESFKNWKLDYSIEEICFYFSLIVKQVPNTLESASWNQPVLVSDEESWS